MLYWDSSHEKFEQNVNKNIMPTIKARKYKDSVYIIYSHKLRIFKIYTGVKIEDKYWNIDSPKKNCPNIDKHKAQIAIIESRVLNASIAARRTFISLCLQKGMPIVDVAKMSGHGDFRSMKPYIQVTRKHLRDVADRWNI